MRSSSRASNDQFVDAVKPALESLLSDLQRTTEVLRRAHTTNNQETGEKSTTTKTTTTTNYHHYPNKGASLEGDDIDADYAEQHTGTYSSRPKSAQKETDSSSFRNDQRSQAGSQLDSMLGNLQVDMDKHGIHTIPKGDCASCGKSIVGQVVIALGKMWHPEHYVCCHCGDEIGHKNFFERGGKAYCETDYHDLFSPRCVYCNGPIRERCITALGKTFHPEHFLCNSCGRPLDDGEGFHEKDGQAFCKEDFYRTYAPKCQGCQKPIKNKFITALGTHWHPECFICQECSCPFDYGANFFDHNGAPLCEEHYHQARGSLCHHCRRPISGRCVSAMGKKFHPEHFFCSYCNRQLCKGTFKEASGKAFCHKCYDRCK